MTNFERFKNMNEDDFINFLLENENDNSPWNDWMNNHFCIDCEPIVGKYEDSEIEMEFAKCELGDCPYNMKDISSEDLIKKWFEDENWR